MLSSQPLQRPGQVLRPHLDAAHDDAVAEPHTVADHAARVNGHVWPNQAALPNCGAVGHQHIANNAWPLGQHGRVVDAQAVQMQVQACAAECRYWLSLWLTDTKLMQRLAQ